jgi:hypothetical protein
VNSLDEVPDSSFYTNRTATLTSDEVRHGGEEGAPMDVSGDLRVVAAKLGGFTPGMIVEDSSGTKFVLKLDPIGRYALLSGCEVIASRLLWAAGYNVPDNRIVYIDPARFVPDADEDAPTAEMIVYVLSHASRRPDGKIRAMASRFVPGKVLGPMPWRGVRKGDPNDRVPHELRRELRGLRLFYVWINNADAKIGNSIDTYVEQPGGGGLVKHYLIDFGTSLTAAGPGVQGSAWFHSYAWRIGVWHEGVQDAWQAVALRDASRLERRERELGHMVTGLPGNVDPYGFQFLWTNAPFMRMDDADATWAMRVMLQISDDHIRAAVASADWPPWVEKYVADQMISRRDSIARSVFLHATSLGTPRLVDGKICAVDLAKRHRLTDDPGEIAGGDRPAERRGDEVCVEAPRGDGYHVVRLTTRGLPARRELRVHVLRGDDDVRIVGVERE